MDQLAIGLFSFGAVLLLLGLVGGNFAWGKVSIPKVGSVARFIAFVLCPLFFIGSVAVWATEVESKQQHEGSSQHAALIDDASSETTSPDPITAPPTVATTSPIESVTFYVDLTLDQSFYDNYGITVGVVQVAVDGTDAGTLTADLTSGGASLEIYRERTGRHQIDIAAAFEGDLVSGSDSASVVSEVRNGDRFRVIIDANGRVGLRRE